MNLIARYYSERGELVRNLERILILFNESEFKLYSALRTALDNFNVLCERSEVLKFSRRLIPADVVRGGARGSKHSGRPG